MRKSRRVAVFHMQLEWLNTLKPNFKVLPLKERMLCGLGALLGLALSSLISWWLLGGINAWYIAPMGASSVLLFAVPASPLAQPWNIVIGNTIAAVIGVTCALYISNLTEAFSVAVALSITAVLGGETVHELGYQFVFYPVLLNSILLLVIAIVFNRLLGKQYPTVAQVNTRSTDPTPTQKVTIQPEDIHQVLAQETQLLDISEYDLQKLILKAQAQADTRFHIDLRCRDIMSKDVLCLYEDEDIQVAVEKFKQVNLMSLPVLNRAEQVCGTLALYEVVEWFQKATDLRTSWQDQVKHIMKRQVVTVQPDQELQDLIPYFVERSFNYIPVVENKALVGIISRADMIAALYRLLQHR